MSAAQQLGGPRLQPLQARRAASLRRPRGLVVVAADKRPRFGQDLDDRIASGEFTDAGSTKEKLTRPIRKLLAQDPVGPGAAPAVRAPADGAGSRAPPACARGLRLTAQVASAGEAGWLGEESRPGQARAGFPPHRPPRPPVTRAAAPSQAARWRWRSRGSGSSGGPRQPSACRWPPATSARSSASPSSSRSSSCTRSTAASSSSALAPRSLWWSPTRRSPSRCAALCAACRRLRCAGRPLWGPSVPISGGPGSSCGGGLGRLRSAWRAGARRDQLQPLSLCGAAAWRQHIQSWWRSLVGGRPALAAAERTRASVRPLRSGRWRKRGGGAGRRGRKWGKKGSELPL